MASTNRIILIGCLDQDPRAIDLDSGEVVTELTLATHERRPDGRGGHIVSTQWHRVELHGSLAAEAAHGQLSASAQVYVEGRLRSRSLKTSDGTSSKAWHVIAQRLQVLEVAPQASQARVEAAPRAPPQRVDAAPPAQRRAGVTARSASHARAAAPPVDPMGWMDQPPPGEHSARDSDEFDLDEMPF